MSNKNIQLYLVNTNTKTLIKTTEYRRFAVFHAQSNKKNNDVHVFKPTFNADVAGFQVSSLVRIAGFDLIQYRIRNANVT